MVERDPVCGMSVVPEKAAATVEFDGKKYFFCGKGCAEKFKKGPGKYLSARAIHETHGMEHAPGEGPVSIRGMKTEAGGSCCDHGAAAGPSQKTAPTTLWSVSIDCPRFI